MKKLMMFSMWLAASATAVGVAWAGVSVVDNQVIDPPPAADFVAADAGATTTALGLDEPAMNGAGQSASSTATTQRSTVANSVATTQTTGRSTSSPTNQPASTQAPTTQAPPSATTKTFTLTGGTAAISFSSAGVEVLWATPNPGFDVKIEPESPGIKVEFRADHHRSRVDAWWSNGPQSSIQEEPRD